MSRCFHAPKLLISAALASALMGTLLIAGQPRPQATVKATVQKVQETRRIVLASQKDENSGFGMFNKPRLEVIVNLELPGNKKLLDVQQPTSIVAKDSTGKDLTNVKPDFAGKKTFLAFNRFVNDDVQQCTLTLATPQRSATTFSVAASFDVWIHNDVKVVPFRPTTKGAKLDGSAFGVPTAVATLTTAGQQVQLIIKPGTIKKRIKSIKLIDGGKEIPSMGSMWNDSSITYMFNAPAGKQYAAKAEVYQGLEKLPCTIELKDQPLP